MVEASAVEDTDLDPDTATAEEAVVEDNMVEQDAGAVLVLGPDVVPAMDEGLVLDLAMGLD